MKLEFVKSVVDPRGRILFCKYGHLSINIIETKKGFSRGGHFHEFSSIHFLLKGDIIFKTTDIKSNHEQIKKFTAPCEINVNANIAHILIALSDAVFIEFFNTNYSSVNYPLYRDLIEKQLH